MTLSLVTDRVSSCTFDEEPHVYRVDGRIVPSVTQTLASVGFIDFSHVPGWRSHDDPGEIMEAARTRGKRVHKSVHYYLEGEIDWSSIREEEQGYVESALGYLRDARLRSLRGPDGRVLGVEFRFFHLGRWYAGTIDYVAWDSDQVLSINDWKTGHPDDVAAGPQTGGYEDGLRKALRGEDIVWIDADGHPQTKPLLGVDTKLHEMPIRRRAIKLHRDGRPGTPEPYLDHFDLLIFQAALTCTHFRMNGCRHRGVR